MPVDNRHISAPVFLGIIAAPLLFIVLLQGLQLYVRHQLEERWESEAEVHLAIPAGELLWIKPGREILVDGHMFDIKSIRYEGGVALVTGVFDHKETEIMKLLGRQGSSSRNNQRLTQLFSWLQQFVAAGTDISFLLRREDSRTFAPFTLAHYTSPVLPFIAPPPQG